MGTEDRDVLAPAVERLRAEGLDIRGPLPADTLFHARARATYDVALAPTHDQALIPIKTIAFDDGVNVTLGLPFIRTSPDHGTAFDIAGKGVARPDSLIAALRLADRLGRNAAQARPVTAEIIPFNDYAGTGAAGLGPAEPFRPDRRAMSAGDGLPPLREVVQRHGLEPKKALGQNFLYDLNLTGRIARSAGPLEGVTVVEVGPGPGGLTRALLAAGAGRVIAIERDARASRRSPRSPIIIPAASRS